MIRLQIAWANLRRRIYDMTHIPTETAMYEWADTLHQINADKTGNSYYIDGVLYRRRWWGLERAA